ncbi:hypothetical protein EYF80_057169 [Liparis tanakae]|uniref:Uncharacterized protein n=1 Tax=Liparis tanakae TaxID=230148 RepID=A0A4Z2EV13_9TELE|nr:hypothetical protein EYF80_057169 [Liparis tanakae]
MCGERERERGGEEERRERETKGDGKGEETFGSGKEKVEEEEEEEEEEEAMYRPWRGPEPSAERPDGTPEPRNREGDESGDRRRVRRQVSSQETSEESEDESGVRSQETSKESGDDWTRRRRVSVTLRPTASRTLSATHRGRGHTRHRDPPGRTGTHRDAPGLTEQLVGDVLRHFPSRLAGWAPAGRAGGGVGPGGAEHGAAPGSSRLLGCSPVDSPYLNRLALRPFARARTRHARALR